MISSTEANKRLKTITESNKLWNDAIENKSPEAVINLWKGYELIYKKETSLTQEAEQKLREMYLLRKNDFDFDQKCRKELELNKMKNNVNVLFGGFELVLQFIGEKFERD